MGGLPHANFVIAPVVVRVHVLDIFVLQLLVLFGWDIRTGAVLLRQPKDYTLW
jgi:hypothetical protein